MFHRRRGGLSGLLEAREAGKASGHPRAESWRDVEIDFVGILASGSTKTWCGTDRENARPCPRWRTVSGPLPFIWPEKGRTVQAAYDLMGCLVGQAHGRAGWAADNLFQRKENRLSPRWISRTRKSMLRLRWAGVCLHPAQGKTRERRAEPRPIAAGSPRRPPVPLNAIKSFASIRSRW